MTNKEQSEDDLERWAQDLERWEDDLRRWEEDLGRWEEDLTLRSRAPRESGGKRRPQRAARRKPMSGWIIALIVFFAFIPVVGILAAFAIPSYQDYVIRTRVAEGLVIAAPYKSRVTEYYAGHGDEFPRGTSQQIAREMNLPDFRETQNVKAIRVLDGGVIEIEYNPVKVTSGRKLLLVPSIDASRGAVVWRCQNSAGNDAFRYLSALPAECRTNSY